MLMSELSGNIIDLCPVGALTSKHYRCTFFFLNVGSRCLFSKTNYCFSCMLSVESYR